MKNTKNLLLPFAIILLSGTFQVLFNTIWNSEDQLFTILKHANNIVLIFGITLALIKLVRLLKRLILNQYDLSAEDNLKSRKLHTQYNVIERILVFILILFALGAALMTFEQIRKFGISIFASAGIAGLIIGLAAQKVIGSVLAGIQIAITQPIRLDDVVIVEKEWGWIEEITITYVVVRLWDKRRLIVPSIYFMEKPFQNWTRVSSDILGTVFLYTDYHVPVDKLREEQTRILSSTPLWDGQINIIQVTDTTEKSMEIRSLVSAKDSPTAFDLRVLLREKLIEFLRDNYPESLPRTRVEIENPAEEKDLTFKP
ncbi:mechanosensitive ion channel family protein [Bacteroidota bacterium]